MRSEAFSAIISTQALMCAETRSGIAEASTTRKPLDAMHAELRIDHGAGPGPHHAGRGRMVRGRGHVPDPVVDLGVGLDLRPRRGLGAAEAARAAAAPRPRARSRTPWRKVGRSFGAVRKLVTIFTLSFGSAERSSTSPRLSGCSRHGPDAVAVGVALLPAGEPERGLERRAAEHELDVGHRQLRPRLDEGVQAARHHGRGPAAEEMRRAAC